MLWLVALIGCARDEVSTCRPVSGTYRISDDTSELFADAANGSAVLDGDLMIFEYTDADGVGWKVTYIKQDYDCGPDSAPE